MQRPEIQIVIDAEGNCTAEGIGFIGSDCSRALRQIDEALGVRTGVRRKPEYVRTVDKREIQH